jgi:hypothetical protein
MRLAKLRNLQGNILSKKLLDKYNPQPASHLELAASGGKQTG